MIFDDAKVGWRICLLSCVVTNHELPWKRVDMYIPSGRKSICTFPLPALRRMGLAAVCVASLIGLTAPIEAQTVIASGDAYSCAILGGTVQCWGSNSLGQLGDGTDTDRSLPDLVTNLSNATGMSASHSTEIAANRTTVISKVLYAHACVVVSGGARCWGTNEAGQLGDGTTTDRAKPVWVAGLGPNSGVVAVAAGNSHTCAVVHPNGGVSNGLMCWGDNSKGQLGDTTQVPRLQPVWVSTLGANAGVLSVTAGARHTCAVIDTGSGNTGAKCWGDNNYGQLGLGSSGSPKLTPQNIPALDTFGPVAISAGYEHTCAIVKPQFGAANGVECWGRNTSGELGRAGNMGVSIYSPAPVATLSPGGAQNISDLSAGPNHTCAIVGDKVQCWGSNSAGQLGYSSAGPTDSLNTPAAPVGGTTGATAIAAGGQHNCALIGSSVKCWGLNDFGQLGNGSDGRTRSPTNVINIGYSRIDAGGSHTCAVANDRIRCWGLNNDGQIGNDSTYPVSYATPISPDGLGASDNITALTISAGRNHSCAVINGSGSKPKIMLCWGMGESGQLGGNSHGDFYTHVSSHPIDVGIGQSQISVIGTGSDHSCAITGVLSTDGIKCWGLNSHGQLGEVGGSTAVPQWVHGFKEGSGFTDLAVGANHACGVKSDSFGTGQLWCWGQNDHGQLGIGNHSSLFIPVQVISSGVTAVAAGARHTCVVKNFGVLCWGDNSSGQLGIGDPNVLEEVTPTPLPNLPNGSFVQKLAAGEAHTCMYGSLNTSVQCWGDNTFGQLGDGTTDNRFEPTKVPVGITPIVSISAGDAHTCFVGNGGGSTAVAQCWGRQLYGRLGDGQFGYVSSPNSSVKFDEIFHDRLE